MREFVPARAVENQGTEPEDDAPTLPPPPYRPSLTGGPEDGSLAAMAAPKPSESAGESWWKRYGWVVAAFIGVAGVFGLGYGARSAQATVTAEGIKPILDRLKAIEDEQKSNTKTIEHVATDVEWLKRAMAKTPGVSTNLNVVAHE